MRREIPHYTEEQVLAHLAAATDMIEDLDIPGDLRPAAFTAAVNLLSAKSITEESFQAPILRPKITGGGHNAT